MYFLLSLVGEVHTDIVRGSAMMKEIPECDAISRKMEKGPLTHLKGSGKASWKAPC